MCESAEISWRVIAFVKKDYGFCSDNAAPLLHLI